MMQISQLLAKSFSIFFTILQVFLLIQIFVDMFSVSFVKKALKFVLDPILNPVRILLSHSSFFTAITDLSPIIAFLMLSYLQQLIGA
ncbi:YggT family protein [Lachnoclostridium phytofermentans]|uniref:YggT family protein n=2 Tax=Lachnoclostridium phytofermentans TaxID=66219 RepID=UPI000496D6B1